MSEMLLSYHMEFSGVSLIYYVHHAESKNKVAELDWRAQFFSSLGRAVQIHFKTNISTAVSCCSGLYSSQIKSLLLSHRLTGTRVQYV